MSGTEEEGWVVLPAAAAGSDAAEGRIDALSIKEEKPQSPGGMLIDVGTDDKPKKGPRRKFVPTQRKGPVIPRSLSGGGSPAPKAGQSVLPRSLSGGGSPPPAAPAAAAPPAASMPTPAATPAAPIAAAATAAAAVRRKLPKLRLGDRLRPTGASEETALSSVVLSEDGRCLVGGGADGKLRMWVRDASAAASGSSAWQLAAEAVACAAQAEEAGEAAHGAEVNALALDGTLLVSGAADGRVRSWRARVEGGGTDGAELYSLRSYADEERGHSAALAAQLARRGRCRGQWGLGVQCVALACAGGPSAPASAESGDRWLLSGGQDGALCVWSLAAGRLLQRAQRKHWVMAVSAASRVGGSVLVLTGSFDGEVVVWLEHGATPAGDAGLAPARTLLDAGGAGKGDGALSVSLSAALGLAAAGFNGGSVRVWPVGPDAGAEGSDAAVATGGEGGVSALSWRGGNSGPAQLLAGAEGGECAAWRYAPAGPAGGAALHSVQSVGVPSAGGGATAPEVLGIACSGSGMEVFLALIDGSVQCLEEVEPDESEAEAIEADREDEAGSGREVEAVQVA